MHESKVGSAGKAPRQRQNPLKKTRIHTFHVYRHCTRASLTPTHIIVQQISKSKACSYGCYICALGSLRFVLIIIVCLGQSQVLFVPYPREDCVGYAGMEILPQELLFSQIEANESLCFTLYCLHLQS